MDSIDKIRLMADLEKEHCTLNHGPVEDNKKPAADYIVIPFGYKESKDVEVIARESIAPICFECASALNGDEWTLLYCIECTNNRWICRKLAKNNYRHHILWLKGCPDCTGKFGGLYFTDNYSG